MKKLLTTLVVLSICINAAWAGGGKPSGGKPVGGKPSGGKPNGGKPNGGKPNGGKPNGGKPNGGKPHGGKSGKWHGWTKKQYSQSFGCYLYWSDEDDCWYRYDPASDSFVPCDN